MCDCKLKEREFKVGDRVRFDYFGKHEEGTIETVGKHGYWIGSTTGGCYGTASIRCPFSDAKKA
jgi:hypothetical protein